MNRRIEVTLSSAFFLVIILLGACSPTPTAKGHPLFYCSKYEIEKEDGFTKVRFSDMTDVAEDKQSDIAIYSDDRYFQRAIGYHFSEEKDDPEFTGWTYLSGRSFGGTKFAAIEKDGTRRDHSVEAATFFSPNFERLKEKISNQAELTTPDAARPTS